MQIFPNGIMRYYSHGVAVPEEPLTLSEPISVSLQQGNRDAMTLTLTSLELENGVGEPQTERLADLDSEGYPVALPKQQMAEVRCTITTVTEHRKGSYDDGDYKSCRYSVTCNLEDVGSDFHPSAVSLCHDDKGELGFYQVQRVEYYHLTNTVELWV